jgi:2,4-dienoyl-CoA reductase-like NADH-dependent reductase (Old Yellow Enzyme family)
VHLLRRIEKFIRRTGVPATRFGREAAGDPRLVFDLRKGREPRSQLTARVHTFLDEREKTPGGKKCSR